MARGVGIKKAWFIVILAKSGKHYKFTHRITSRFSHLLSCWSQRAIAGPAILDRGLGIEISYHRSVPPYIQSTIVTIILRRQAACFHSQVAALATGIVAATAIQKNEDLTQSGHQGAEGES